MAQQILPYMVITIPTPGDSQGIGYAQTLNTALTAIDSHNHTEGKGVLIPSAAIAIDADLPFNSYNATTLRTTRYDNQAAPLVLATDLLCIYASGGELYYNDINGTAVKMTDNGAVNVAAAGSISGMGGTSASVTYTDINKTFTFLSAASTPAILSVGPIKISRNVSSPFGVTVAASASQSSDYNVTFAPALPSAQNLMSMSNTGQIANVATDGNTVNINANVISANIPPGMAVPYFGTSAPTGWLLCNGQAVSRTTYAALFAVIGITNGQGNGTTTFNLPDARGLFLRGTDGGRGLDPNAATRTAAATGGNTGDNVGSYQTGAFASHTHGVTDPGHNHSWDKGAGAVTAGNRISGNGTNSGTGGSGIQSNTTGITIDNTGGSETRPVNLYCNYIIKF